MTADAKVKRLVGTLSADAFVVLDGLAEGPRFGGNRSRALEWCVRIGASVLDDAAVRDRLFGGPDEALAAFVAAVRK